MKSNADRTARSALQVIRSGDASTLRAWNVDQDSITEHDRRHAILRENVTHGNPNNREVAEAIRPVLEAFLRVACPDVFPPGKLLGPFLSLCREWDGTNREVLETDAIQELQHLNEYASKFHHDTNPAWDIEIVNDEELKGFVERALAFTSP